MPSSFLCPQIVFGWNSLQELAHWHAERAAIITDRTMHDLGYVAGIHETLAGTGADVRVVGCVNREPYVSDVELLVSGLLEYGPDLIVGLGGGAVMDAAKTAWAFFERPLLDWQTAFTPNGMGRCDGRARFVAIPTTSGAGSEVSRVAVLIDPMTRLKRLVMSPHLMPNAALLDPELACSMPPALTAHSGFDALTHAVEALVTQATNEFSRANALDALRLIFENLPPSAVKRDRAAREKMHYAATLASLAASNSFAGLAHGMDQVGPLFQLPHGLVCAVLVPHTIAFNLSAARDAYAEMGTMVGLAMSDPLEGARGFLGRVIALQSALNVPASFSDCGVSERDYFGAMDTLVRSALESRSTQLSPRVPDAEQARELFERAYWGNLPA